MRQFLFIVASSLRNEGCDLWGYLKRRPLILVLLVVVMSIAVLKKAGRLDNPSPLDPVQFSNRVGEITGVVSKHPDARLSGCVYIVDVESGAFFEEPRIDTALRGELLLHIVKSRTPLASPGDRIRFVGRIQKPKPSLIPGTFDYESYLENQGIHAMVYTSSSSLRILGSSGQYQLVHLGWRFKKKILDTFAARLSSPEAAVLAGLSIGVRPRFHPEIKRIFTESGTMHVLVASGSNVAFVVVFFFFLFRYLLRIPKRISLILTLGPVGLYVLIVGSDAPILRAALMASVGIFGYLTMREDKAYHALALSALIILLLSPTSLYDVGFQMSFVTVFGLVHFLSLGPEWMEQNASWRTWLGRIALSTLTAQLWLIPITTNVFHQFYPVGLIANIVMLPLAAAGLTAALVVTLIPTAVHHYLSALISVARFFSDTIGQTIWVPSISPLIIIGFYMFCVFVRFIRESWLCRAGCGLGIILLIIGSVPKSFSIRSELQVSWLDLGRDLGCALQTEEGHQILINAGRAAPSDSTQRTLMPFLTTRGLRSLNVVIITHSQWDRVAGLESLYRSIDMGPALSLIEGRSLLVGNVKITRLHESKGFENNAALLVEYKNIRLVLSDVLSLASQDDLLNRKIKSVDVLQSRFSPGVKWRDEFVDRIKPTHLVETGPGSQSRPSVPPWKDTNVAIPQKTGWISLSLSENPNADKPGDKPTRVGPPGDTAHIPSHCLRAE